MAPVCADGEGLSNHEVVNYSVGGNVKGKGTCNRVESFRPMLAIGYVGTFRRFSIHHLHRDSNPDMVHWSCEPSAALVGLGVIGAPILERDASAGGRIRP